MDCPSELGGGLTMQDVTLKHIQQWIDGFVDDTSLFTNITRNGGNPNDVNNLHEKLRLDMLIWKDLLEISGGALQLEKCFYYVLSRKFDEDGNPHSLTIEEQRKQCKQISIQNTSGEGTTFIIQKEVCESHTTLGCKKAIEGNEENQIEALSTCSRQFGLGIKNSRLDRREGILAYNCIYMSSIKYCLLTTSLSKKTLSKIQSFPVKNFYQLWGITIA
jgi:hypothetical protein